jgi:hypothetical protein
MNNIKYVIDVSGFSFSGKSSVTDLLSGQFGVKAFDRELEFDLLRAPGGLLDLRKAICAKNWSPVRSSEAIRRFKRLTYLMGGRRSITDRLLRSGNNYDLYFPRFTKLSNEFVSKLIIASWMGPWPYYLYSSSSAYNLYAKLRDKFYWPVHNEIYLSRVEDSYFQKCCAEYLNELFSVSSKSDSSIVLLSNAFECFNPKYSMELVTNAKSIVVDRDPRDIYLSAYSQAKNSKSQVGRSVIGSSVHDYILRYKTFRDSVVQNESDVLRLSFEDVIQKTRSVISDIETYLDIPEFSINLEHSNLCLDSSRKNIELWKNPISKNLKLDVQIIESELITSHQASSI